MNLQTIAENLAALADTCPGVRAYPFRRSQFVSSADADVAVIIVPADNWVDYYSAMRGGQCIVRWTLQIRIPIVSEEHAQRRLMGLLSAGTGTVSLYDTIKPGDLPQTLSGVIHDLKLDSARPVTEDWDDVVYLGADVAVEMLADRM